MSGIVQLIEKIIAFFPQGSGHLAGLGLVISGLYAGLTTHDWLSAATQIVTGLGILFGVQGTVTPPASK